MHCIPMPPSPKIAIPPGSSRDAVTKPSQFRVKQRQPNIASSLCPHVKLGGGLCGRAPKHCLCLCMLCQSPMLARQVCNSKLDDGSVCTWGADNRSPEPPMTTPRKMLGRLLFGDQSIGLRNLCLPNLEPGGPAYVGGVNLSVTPKRRERTPKKSTFSTRHLDDPSIFDLTPSPSLAGSPAKLLSQTPRPRPAIPLAWQP